MGNRRHLQNKIEKLLAQYDKEVRDAFLKAARNKSRGVNIKELAKAIEQRDIGRAIKIAALTRGELYALDVSINAAYVAGGNTVADAAPTFAAVFGFDGKATRAAEWARSHVGALVTGIVEEQQAALREVISQQIAEGENPRTVATRVAGHMKKRPKKSLPK